MNYSDNDLINELRKSLVPMSSNASACSSLLDELQYRLESKYASQPNAASAQLTFDLLDPEGIRLFEVYVQAPQLHSFAFEIVFNFIKKLEWAVDADPEGDPIDIARSVLVNLIESHNFNL